MRRGRSLAWVLVLLVGCANNPGDEDAGPGGDFDAGERFDSGPRQPPGPVPSVLSETGLFAAGASGPYADDVLTFDVRFTSWVDDAAKRRHIRLPPGTRIDTTDPERWLFPEGTAIWKEFFVDGRPVETRLLLKTGPGYQQWTYMSYAYRADGTEADAVPMGMPDALGTGHDVPGQDGCLECHQGGPDFPLGFSAIQLTRPSFDELLSGGLLSRGATFAVIPGNEVERVALGYLHANCGHCHIDGHPVSENRELRLNLGSSTVDVTRTNAYLTAVGGVATDRVSGTFVWIEPGDPDMSQIVARMGQRSNVGMPPRFTSEVDDFGVNAVSDWIRALGP